MTVKRLPNDMRFNIFKARRLPGPRECLEFDLGMKFKVSGMPVQWLGAIPQQDEFVVEVIGTTYPVTVRETQIVDPRELYFYRCFVSRVYDGDTATKVLVILGNVLGVHSRVWSVRFSDLDTPEMNEPGGVEMRDLARRLILNRECILLTDEDQTGKYGRLVGTFFIGNLNVNKLVLQTMKTEGYSE